MKALEALLGIVRAIVKIVVVALFSYLAFAILLQVVGRYFANYIDLSIEWTEESACFAQIWLILMAAGLAMRERMHVGVDILMQYVPNSLQKPIIAVTSAACLVFLYIAITNSFRLIQVGAMQTSPALNMPMSYVFIAMPIGLSYFGLEFILVTWKRLTASGSKA